MWKNQSMQKKFDVDVDVFNFKRRVPIGVGATCASNVVHKVPTVSACILTPQFAHCSVWRRNRRARRGTTGAAQGSSACRSTRASAHAASSSARASRSRSTWAIIRASAAASGTSAPDSHEPNHRRGGGGGAGGGRAYWRHDLCVSPWFCFSFENRFLQLAEMSCLLCVR